MRVLLTVLLVLLCFPSIAQEDDDLRVPDLNGMTFPSAIAELERIGLILGEETVQVSEDAPRSEANRVLEQSPAPGTVIEAGDSVDLTVLRTISLRLIWDDNDITFINPADVPLPIGGLVFRSIGSVTPSDFVVDDANDWSPVLDPGECYQLWTVGRVSAKDVRGCPPANRIPWFFTGIRNSHFWTGWNGAAGFEVVQGDIVRATCEIADGICEMHSAAIAEYIYFTYTMDQLVIRNTSSEGWMLLPEFDAAPDRLAPGQCVVFQTDNAEETTSPLVECDVVSEVALEESFWESGVEITSTSPVSRTCPPPIADETMICLLAR